MNIVPLGNIAKVQSGYAFKKQDWSDSGYPVVKIQHVRAGHVSLENCSYISEEAAKLSEHYILFRGDVLVTMSGEIGSVGVVRVDRPIFVNQRVGRVTPTSPDIDLLYLGYAMQEPKQKQRMENYAYGAAQPNISPTLIESLPIYLPKLVVQKQIAKILGNLDDLIENNRRRIEILEEMARLLYREWFVHFRFPGYEGIELVDSDLGPIPEGWQIAKLSHLVSTQYGYTETACSEPVGPRYLRGMDINKNSFIDWSTVPYCPISGIDHQKFAIQVDDVFVIRMADPGKVGICERPVDAVFASYLVRLRPSDGRITPYYLYFTLSDEAYQSWVTGASTGATRKSVSAKVMTEPNVAVPPIDILEQFDKTVRQARSLMNNLLEQNAVLRKARDLLLPRLISGEIDVSELDLDLESSET